MTRTTTALVLGLGPACLGCLVASCGGAPADDPPVGAADVAGGASAPPGSGRDAGARIDSPDDAPSEVAADARKPGLPSPFSLVVPDGFGVDTHVADPSPALMDAMQRGGFRWARQDFPWPVIEAQKGAYDWAGIGFDAVTAAWDKRGLRGLNVLGGANPLYGPGLPISASQRKAFTSFVASAVTRYRGRGYLWEIWNEPEHDWAPADYAQLVKDVAETVRTVAPGELLVGPALGFANGSASDDLVWLEEVFKAGALDDLAAVTVHPYLDQPESVFQEYQALRSLIAKYAPGKSIPVLSGEWGFQTSTTGGVSDAVQAQMVTRVYLTNLFNEVPISIWYDWNDDGTDPAVAEDRYGLVGPRPAMTPKPAYYAASNLADLLGGYRLERRVSAGSQDEDLVLRFVRAGEPGAVFVGWVMTPGMSHTMTIPASELAGSPSSILVRGNTGEKLPSLTAGAGGLTVTLDNSPTYFVAK